MCGPARLRALRSGRAGPWRASVEHKANSLIALYDGSMANTGELRVSARGQMSLPATARHRWRLDEGGDVSYLDIGDAVIIVPHGIAQLRRDLLSAVTADDWTQARLGFGDRDLATE